jgi:hypothetical protein
MNTDDGFRRKTWDNRSTNTEMPSVPDTQVPRSRPPREAGLLPLMWLIVSRPSEQRGMVLPIAAGQMIGRQGDIRWPDSRMSRQHAQFLLIDDPADPTNKVFAIAPHQDRNGTLVNGKRITETTPLMENDVIIMGDTRFVVKVLD